ncbi:hypothetical protein [Providencia phage PSTCR9]|nr:hypothetical protein [Providencia phage PSTCR9]
MVGLWFLVMTLCPIGNSNDCHDYILDEGMSYADCVAALPKESVNRDIYAVSCTRGEPLESKQ